MRSWATPEYALTLGYAADNDVWPVSLPEGAPGFARFADAAVADLRPVDNGSSDALTVLLLLAQSIELTLKAFLQPRGYNQEKLRREIGHDLPRRCAPRSRSDSRSRIHPMRSSRGCSMTRTAGAAGSSTALQAPSSRHCHVRFGSSRSCTGSRRIAH